MRKRFKSKKKFNLKFLFISLILFIIILVFKHIINTSKLSSSNQIIIHNIFKTNNNYSYKEKENNITKEIYTCLKNKIFNSPINILKTELKYDKKEKKVTTFIYNEVEEPIVYIYNSHQGERYSMEYLEDYNIVPDVLMASYMLEDKLDNLNINTIVEENDILDYMKKNNLDHSESYKASRVFLNKAVKNYPNAKLYIDLHRDAASHDVTVTTINGKKCAKVLFVIGLENNTYEKNLSVVTELNNVILEKYPSLTRGIMKKEGYGVNGVYNQDLASNVILIEIGGHENNIEEINNTLDLISQVIGEYLNEKE